MAMKRQRDRVTLLSHHLRECKPQKILGRMEFECRTCNHKFPSFQALGGHRASRKKPKLEGQEQSKIRPKTHQCSICAENFSSGQALGGHMKRHRINSNIEQGTELLKGSNSKRVLFLDLNLTPLQNDLSCCLGTRHPNLIPSLINFSHNDD